MKRSFATACKKNDIPYGRKVDKGITFHDIRRTVKTNMVSAGVDKIYRDVMLGHSLQGMDAFYVKPDDKTLSEAMTKYSTWLSDQIVTTRK